MTRIGPLFAAAAVACATGISQAPPDATGPVNLHAEPPGLGFDCVAPGCREQKVLRLVSDGPDTARIHHIKLDATTSADFELGELPPLPVDLAPGAALDLGVTYLPSDARPDVGGLVVTYGSPARDERLELRVELVVRYFGVPRVDVTPRVVSFGYVPVGQRGTVDVRVKNVGSGNALLEVSAAGLLEATHYAASPAVPPPLLLAPLQEGRITLSYAPLTEGVHLDRLTLVTNDPERESVEVLVRGTSVPGPRATIEPSGPFDFGEVRVGSTKEQSIEIANVGGEPLRLRAWSFSGDGAAQYRASPEAPPADPVAPFASTTVRVTYAPTVVGDHPATLVIESDDPLNESLAVGFTARGIDPRLVIEPTTIEYGPVVVGWTRGPTAVVARNEGVGPLTIERIFMAPGSSPEIELGAPPALPIVLGQADELTLEVRYVASTLSAVRATLVIESDDASRRSAEVAISGQGVSCEEGCAMANATPRCDSGACEIRACASGYYDTDGRPTNGCECRIESPEPSSFCAEARFLGSLVDDNGDSRTVTGQLHRADDVDWYSFFAVDSGGLNELFGDDFDVRITLSGPPGYKMCVFRVQRGVHEDVCPNGTDGPCEGTTSYRDDGSYGRADDADYFIKVWTDQPRATCQPYTLSIRNG